MNDDISQKKPRVAVIPQLARVDWLHYAIYAGRIVCGIWLLVFLWYGWKACQEYRLISSAVSLEGATPEAFVRLEGAFSAGGPAPITSPGRSKAVLFEGLEKDCGLSSFWYARLTMYQLPRKGGPFSQRTINLETDAGKPFSITPAGGKPYAVVGVPTAMYGTSNIYRFDPSFLTDHLTAGPNLDVSALTASSGFILGQLKKGEMAGQDWITPHQKGFIFSGIPLTSLSHTLLLRLSATILCIFFLANAAMITQRFACLDRALDHPAQFCVFEATGGWEMFGTVGIVLGSFLSLMMVSPPPFVSESEIFLLHTACAVLMFALVIGASRVEFFYVANKGDGNLYKVSKGPLGSGFTRIMNLKDFKPKVHFEEVVDRNLRTNTSHFLETPTPDGGVLYVSDSFRESIGPAEILSEYERFLKTEMTQPPIDVQRLLY